MHRKILKLLTLIMLVIVIGSTILWNIFGIFEVSRGKFPLRRQGDLLVNSSRNPEPKIRERSSLFYLRRNTFQRGWQSGWLVCENDSRLLCQEIYGIIVSWTGLNIVDLNSLLANCFNDGTFLAGKSFDCLFRIQYKDILFFSNETIYKILDEVAGRGCSEYRSYFFATHEILACTLANKSVILRVKS